MKSIWPLICLVLLSSPSARPQVPSDSDLLDRIKLNRTHFPTLDLGPSLREKADLSGEDVAVTKVVKETPILCDHCPPPDPANHPDVIRATHESDLVAIGHVLRNTSCLTQNEAFIFTDSQFVIDEIWKPFSPSSSSLPLAINSEITLATPGGIVVSNGHTISAFLSNIVPLRTGHSYLMYLKYMPDSSSFFPGTLYGFDLTANPVLLLHTTLSNPAQTLSSNRTDFLRAMHSSTLLGLR